MDMKGKEWGRRDMEVDVKSKMMALNFLSSPVGVEPGCYQARRG